MKRIKKLMASLSYLLLTGSVFAQNNSGRDFQVDESALKFSIPTFGDILTFLIRGFFAIAGVAALVYLLLGAFSWVTSGGNKENVEKAREKIVAAITGVILVVVVVAVVATLEQVVFQGRLCFGLTCPFTVPALLKAP
jgi:cytochrome bd-type quinol oxidase subunit 2